LIIGIGVSPRLTELILHLRQIARFPGLFMEHRPLERCPFAAHNGAFRVHADNKSLDLQALWKNGSDAQSMDAIRRPSAAAGTTASLDGAGSVLVVGLSRSWG
jgi:hypothetical protein